jgi:TM2 domain-containing membrane protein YozV
MMRLVFLLIIFSTIFLKKAHASAEPFFIVINEIEHFSPSPDYPLKIGKYLVISPEKWIRFKEKTSGSKRITAISLAILLGPFGVHRLYLGTEPIVPVAYVMTLGGAMGIIPAIDAVLILVTKDLSKFENNSRFFMWTE